MIITPNRFTALDVFRGITVCLMIIVNSPGDYNTTFAPLLHAQWNGFTPTDLVFPSFLFAVGNSISFVLPKWRNLSQLSVLAKILKRTTIIFLLGFLMYWFPFVKFNQSNELLLAPFDETRIFGVLQRIALCYGIASLLIYYCKTKTVFIISIILLLLYWFLLLNFGDVNDPFGMQTNFGFIVDKWLVGENHLYNGEGVAFDPEGLLGTIPAVSNVIGGYLAGKFIQEKGKTHEMLLKLMLVGSCLLVISYFWNLTFPVNKKLWTSSFVTLTVGIDLIILAFIIYVIDFLNKTKWTNFFIVFGRNPLVIYILSELILITLMVLKVNDRTTAFKWIYYNFFAGVGDYIGSFLFAITVMLFCWVTGYILDKKKIYIKV
ncbi:heparan-alpha-glucosaminide N-acetyltransferase domain-containing protein [uncultured Flavobacterium sp.]|mgnify:CR=1 FL=1|uniref:acyltransferase family protein n=1 Tax=uncultured Flavobacterium sp. TaxID=165435 RepID=UPI0030ECB548|tara:strand:- start:10223 stop:11350 length:1128 start_codon:yes stop_codon:yes gene_type:complete